MKKWNIIINNWEASAKKGNSANHHQKRSSNFQCQKIRREEKKRKWKEKQQLPKELPVMNEQHAFTGFIFILSLLHSVNKNIQTMKAGLKKTMLFLTPNAKSKPKPSCKGAFLVPCDSQPLCPISNKHVTSNKDLIRHFLICFLVFDLIMSFAFTGIMTRIWFRKHSH